MFKPMILAAAAAASLALVSAAGAAVQPFPASFQVRDIAVDGATIHVRVGGHGPAVLMLHGFGDSGDMWQPLAVQMMGDHTVIVPDLRGMGLSSHPDHGYEKKAEAADIAAVLAALHVDRYDLVTHDIGNMVGYALAVQQSDKVRRWVVMDAPLPGLGHWDDQLKNPKTWHFNFHGPDEERLVAGRERIFLDRFYNELSADPKGIDEQTRQHYAALYARPHAMHDALEQFVAFPKDAIDNQGFVAAHGKLKMPVLAIGGSASYADSLATEIGFAAENVTPLVIQNSGHWLMEEQPAATTAAIRSFLGKP
ncbi:MAG TPA: alpha/beta hydrolase [Phenylobacterium sp.]|jgi:pimeloyl-ACP methyl ester carboxylesterase